MATPPDYQRTFHRYSFGNVVLIAAQCPEATRVAGFRAWNKVHRTVKRGERAIWILAPMVTRAVEEEEPRSARSLRGFRYVPVFDLSQTEGEDPPTVCNVLTGQDPAGWFLHLTGLARAIGYSVELAELPPGVNGDCAFGIQRIRVAEQVPPAQQVKTLAHDRLTAPVANG